MSKRPYFRFYPGDYLSDTTSFKDATEHGVYLLLLMAYWKNGGPLENDESSLRATAKISLHKWKKIWPKLSKKFVLSDAHIAQPRMDEEIAKAIEKSGKARNSVGFRKDRRNSTNVHTNDVLVSKSVVSKRSPPKSPTKIEYPDWLDTQAWEEFVGERRRLGKKMSDLAQKKAINKLKALIDDGQHQRSVLDQSIANGWTGLFPVKLNGTHIREPAKDDAPPAFSLMGNDALASWADKMGTSLVGMSTEGAARHLAAKFRAT